MTRHGLCQRLTKLLGEFDERSMCGFYSLVSIVGILTAM
jgi:hypothetical protein